MIQLIEKLFAILRHYSIPQKLVLTIKTLYDHSTSKVLVDGELTNEFSERTGVLQGDILAPFLFIIVVDYLMRNSEEEHGVITHP